MRTLTIKNTACAVALLAGCANPAQSSCEETRHTMDEVQRAAHAAIAELERSGVAINPSAWDDPELFDALAQATASKLGCELPDGAAVAARAESTRRHAGGSDGCEMVGADAAYADYDATLGYCGPGAVRQGVVLWELRHPGECMNRVCYLHDRCYDITTIPAIGSEAVNVCDWSDVTSACDDDFFAGFRDCASREISACGCGAPCLIVGAIASEIRDLSASTGTSDECVTACLATAGCEVGAGEAEAESDPQCATSDFANDWHGCYRCLVCAGQTAGIADCAGDPLATCENNPECVALVDCYQVTLGAGCWNTHIAGRLDYTELFVCVHPSSCWIGAVCASCMNVPIAAPEGWMYGCGG